VLEERHVTYQKNVFVLSCMVYKGIMEALEDHTRG